jgi:two-component system sensor histidine kinase ChvG
MEAVDLAQLLRALVEVANQVERADRVKVRLSIEGDGVDACWLVFGHDSRLSQVINNLVDNARTFSDPGGEVRVTLRPSRGGAQDGQPAREGLEQGFEIIVDDDGPGIPAHAFERIFERFYTDRPNQSFGQNSGLGLSISRQIVEAHGGAIHAENREDEDGDSLGARFVVFLPAPAE